MPDQNRKKSLLDAMINFSRLVKPVKSSKKPALMIDVNTEDDWENSLNDFGDTSSSKVPEYIQQQIRVNAIPAGKKTVYVEDKWENTLNNLGNTPSNKIPEYIQQQIRVSSIPANKKSNWEKDVARLAQIFDPRSLMNRRERNLVVEEGNVFGIPYTGARTSYPSVGRGPTRGSSAMKSMSSSKKVTKALPITLPWDSEKLKYAYRFKNKSFKLPGVEDSQNELKSRGIANPENASNNIFGFKWPSTTATGQANASTGQANASTDQANAVDPGMTIKSKEEMYDWIKKNPNNAFGRRPKTYDELTPEEKAKRDFARAEEWLKTEVWQKLSPMDQDRYKFDLNKWNYLNALNPNADKSTKPKMWDYITEIKPEAPKPKAPDKFPFQPDERYDIKYEMLFGPDGKVVWDETNPGNIKMKRMFNGVDINQEGAVFDRTNELGVASQYKIVNGKPVLVKEAYKDWTFDNTTGLWNWVERTTPGYKGWVFDEGSGKWFQKSKKSNQSKSGNSSSKKISKAAPPVDWNSWNNRMNNWEKTKGSIKEMPRTKEQDEWHAKNQKANDKLAGQRWYDKQIQNLQPRDKERYFADVNYWRYINRNNPNVDESEAPVAMAYKDTPWDWNKSEYERNAFAYKPPKFPFGQDERFDSTTTIQPDPKNPGKNKGVKWFNDVPLEEGAVFDRTNNVGVASQYKIVNGQPVLVKEAYKDWKFDDKTGMYNWVERATPGYTGWVFDEGSGKWFQKSAKSKKSNVKKQMNTNSVINKKATVKTTEKASVKAPYSHRSSKYGV